MIRPRAEAWLPRKSGALCEWLLTLTERSVRAPGPRPTGILVQGSIWPGQTSPALAVRAKDKSIPVGVGPSWCATRSDEITTRIGQYRAAESKNVVVKTDGCGNPGCEQAKKGRKTSARQREWDKEAVDWQGFFAEWGSDTSGFGPPTTGQPCGGGATVWSWTYTLRSNEGIPPALVDWLQSNAPPLSE